MTHRFEELIWAELDGELSAAESRELADLRAAGTDQNGADSSVEPGIRDLAARLAEVEDVEAPKALKAKILTAIEKRSIRSEDNVAPFVIPSAPERVVFRAKWGYLAAGLFLAGFLIYQLGSRLDLGSRSEMVGTVPAAAPAPAAGIADNPAGDRRPGGSMLPEYLRTSGRDGLLEISLEQGKGSSTLSVRAPGLAVRQVDFEDGAQGSYQAEAGRITLVMTGPGRVELVLVTPDPGEPIAISAFGDQLESFEGEFTFDQLSGS